MFRGQFIHSVDAKGRISLPARFRDVLVGESNAGFVVTPAVFDPCLHVWPMKTWEAFEQEVSKLPSMDPHAVRFRRMYVSAAVECELDKAGRVLVPPHLRQRAELDKSEALWAGTGRNLELWSRARWDAALEIAPSEMSAFRLAVEQFKV
jgi:MraZ protein